MVSLKKRRGQSAATFDLKSKVLGPKTALLEAIVLEDPKTGFMGDTQEKIKEQDVKKRL